MTTNKVYRGFKIRRTTINGDADRPVWVGERHGVTVNARDEAALRRVIDLHDEDRRRRP